MTHKRRMDTQFPWDLLGYVQCDQKDQPGSIDQMNPIDLFGLIDLIDWIDLIG